MHQRVRFAVLLQLAEHGTADRATTAAMVPGADELDLKMALENLSRTRIDRGRDLASEVASGAGGRAVDTLTALGRQH